MNLCGTEISKEKTTVNSSKYRFTMVMLLILSDITSSYIILSYEKGYIWKTKFRSLTCSDNKGGHQSFESMLHLFPTLCLVLG